jgi:hypothetical protein
MPSSYCDQLILEYINNNKERILDAFFLDTLLFNKNVGVLSLILAWAFLIAYSRLALSLYDSGDVPDNFVLGISNALFINRVFLKKPICQSSHV